MTKHEILRQSKDYIQSMEKIKSYRKGFRFNMDFNQIPRRLHKGMMFILDEAVSNGYLECVSFEFDLDGNVTSKTYVRL